MTQQLEVHGAPLVLAPEVFKAELSEWVSFGELPDNDLLVAILRNDLHAVVAYGGHWLLVNATLNWLYNFAPPQCFGSVELVRVWTQRGGAEGKPMRRRGT